MRNRRLLSFSIVLFVLAQCAWFSLLGLFVYRFFIARNMASQIEGQFSIHVDSTATSLFILIGGCILYVTVSVAMAIIFKNLSSQLRLTGTYDTFIANVTHELKSPLASINLYLETLKMRDVPPERLNEFIEMMLKDANRLNKLITSILKISAMEQKKEIFEVQLHIADDIIRSILEDIRVQFKLSDSALRLEGSAPHTCVVDQNALYIVFNNLVDNSIKYSMNSPAIRVRLGNTSKNILVEFSDNGIGVTAKEQKKMFRKFHRIENKNVPNVQGTGLGLYWVREIIKFHAGSISIYSDGIGRGTTFTIELPIYQISKTRYLNKMLRWTNRKKRQQERIYDSATIQSAENLDS
ncbi:HAMP domain-containing histidine kinase [candidate division KSB1 bacterium]|nr:HAMP domain-containing histidine kinase [candidate division KSB1 bacterium]